METLAAVRLTESRDREKRGAHQGKLKTKGFVGAVEKRVASMQPPILFVCITSPCAAHDDFAEVEG